MDESLSENAGELNQMCKRALLKAGQKPDDLGLYWLQLVDWALQSGELTLDRSRAYPVRMFLDQQYQLDPREVMNFLQLEDPEDPESEEMQVAEPKDWDPVDLAAQILDHLDSKLSAYMEDYPVAKPLD